MTWLIDTNVVSDLRRPDRANESFRRWFEQRADDPMYVSAVTLGEIEQGVCHAEHRDQAQGAVLRAWFRDRVLPVFHATSIPVDTAVAREAARLRVPDPDPWVDSIVAATARLHQLTLVTRNTADFQSDGLHVIDPWQAPTSG